MRLQSIAVLGPLDGDRTSTSTTASAVKGTVVTASTPLRPSCSHTFCGCCGSGGGGGSGSGSGSGNCAVTSSIASIASAQLVAVDAIAIAIAKRLAASSRNDIGGNAAELRVVADEHKRSSNRESGGANAAQAGEHTNMVNV